MATSKTTDIADDVADAAASTGHRAGAQARHAGADLGDTIDRTANAGAGGVRRAARKTVAAHDAAAVEFDGRAESLEDAIRRNPLAAAGAALLIGVVLGRFFL
ncbi:hypothetical protein IHQ68_14825 [Chelatococcus sambhunathii]|uniref:DUF883 domain-containing protein n=1 Tax=Chelatococcus sambhunathii TaxID=363953 RepID=A0ABU1DIT6_9HYPH|nr:hypothetical protein [Chelatococcus sambhunathii]MDR4307894.1 hypothetical protein [Chelatococcus sambhunathii]